jgi:hypothetical protein
VSVLKLERIGFISGAQGFTLFLGTHAISLTLQMPHLVFCLQAALIQPALQARELVWIAHQVRTFEPVFRTYFKGRRTHPHPGFNRFRVPRAPHQLPAEPRPKQRTGAASKSHCQPVEFHH